MYNTKVVCTYNTSQVFLDTDEISDDDKTFVRNAIYRQELLDIFGLEEYNEKKIQYLMRKLLVKLKDCKEINECIAKVASNFMIQDVAVIGLMLLYSYDYMHLTHICVSDFLDRGELDEMNIRNLKAAIF